MHLTEIIGWFGFALYLIAYFLLAINRIAAGTLYFSLNIVAALGITVVSMYKGTYQAVVVNVLWIGISCLGITQYKLRNFFDARTPFRISMIILLAIAVALVLSGQDHWAIALLGWIYVLAFILSYLLFVDRRITLFEFHIWNFVAPLSILPKLIVDANWPVFALEVFWALSASFGIAQKFILVRERSPKRQ
ncbi:hypothetical protein GWN42_19145 [candidate division KSB1 bacterium]|nr:hypothetical protein [candidate division KSB1 bacterium]